MSAPDEIHLNYFKLYMLAVFCGGGAAASLWGAATQAEGRESVLFLVIGLILGFVGWSFWRRARGRIPLLVIGEEGFTDARFGFVPWEKLRRWRHSTSIVSPGFGWDLKRGERPERNALLFRLEGLMNALGGAGQRTYRRQMIVGGVDPIADAFRRRRPDLQAR